MKDVLVNQQFVELIVINSIKPSTPFWNGALLTIRSFVGSHWIYFRLRFAFPLAGVLNQGNESPLTFRNAPATGSVWAAGVSCIGSVTG